MISKLLEQAVIQVYNALLLPDHFGISILGGLNPAERVGAGDGEYEMGTGEEDLMISLAQARVVKWSEL